MQMGKTIYCLIKPVRRVRAASWSRRIGCEAGFVVSNNQWLSKTNSTNSCRICLCVHSSQNCLHLLICTVILHHQYASISLKSTLYLQRGTFARSDSSC